MLITDITLYLKHSVPGILFAITCGSVVLSTGIDLLAVIRNYKAKKMYARLNAEPRTAPPYDEAARKISRDKALANGWYEPMPGVLAFKVGRNHTPPSSQ